MIVVTGGAGFIGSNLVAGLEARGEHEIVVCDRLGKGDKWRNLAKRELARLIGQIQRGGYTLVPLSIYFNERGIAKLELAVARGKRKADKRESEKQRDWQRQKARLMREKG